MTMILNITLPPDGNPNRYLVPVGLFFDDPVYHTIDDFVNMTLLDDQLHSATFETELVSTGFGPVTAEGGIKYLVVIVAFADVPTQADRDTVDAVIIAHDRTQLTPEQQAAADLAAELATINAKIETAKANRDAITGPSTGGTQTAPGLKDWVNGNATFSVVGMKTPLQNANWNTLTDAQRISLLRDMWRGTGGALGLNDILIALLNAALDGNRADLTELRAIRDKLLDGIGE